MGGGRDVLSDTKSGGGGGGGEVIPYNQTSAWDGPPTVLQCFSLCLNTILRCNMQIE